MAGLSAIPPTSLVLLLARVEILGGLNGLWLWRKSAEDSAVSINIQSPQQFGVLTGILPSQDESGSGTVREGMKFIDLGEIEVS
jgi:hypothetical protein